MLVATGATDVAVELVLDGAAGSVVGLAELVVEGVDVEVAAGFFHALYLCVTVPVPTQTTVRSAADTAVTLRNRFLNTRAVLKSSTLRSAPGFGGKRS